MEAIRTEPQPDCIACGAPGAPLYEALTDRLYGAPGTWRLARCTDDRCALLWLDPMPMAEDLSLAYAAYYTHHHTHHHTHDPTHDHTHDSAPNPGRAPAHRHGRDAYFLYLKHTAPGRLLEIGCGDGARLRAFRELGWEVTGQETDPRAAAAARRDGELTVLEGELGALNLAAGAYDAIVMNHVLEHVRDPRALLAECRRLLAPGGVLAAATPNARGLGHKLFGRAWRGLEPPRHLFVYTPGALRTLAGEAGFSRPRVFSQAVNAAGTVIRESLRLPEGATGSRRGLWRPLVWPAAQLFRALEAAWLRVDAQAGEEIILLACREAGHD